LCLVDTSMQKYYIQIFICYGNEINTIKKVQRERRRDKQKIVLKMQQNNIPFFFLQDSRLSVFYLEQIHCGKKSLDLPVLPATYGQKCAKIFIYRDDIVVFLR